MAAWRSLPCLQRQRLHSQPFPDPETEGALHHSPCRPSEVCCIPRHFAGGGAGGVPRKRGGLPSVSSGSTIPLPHRNAPSLPHPQDIYMTSFNKSRSHKRRCWAPVIQHTTQHAFKEHRPVIKLSLAMNGPCLSHCGFQRDAGHIPEGRIPAMGFQREVHRC